MAKEMHNSIKITLIIVAAVLLLVSIGIYFWKSNSASNTISVSGKAEVQAAPDLISVYFNADTEGQTSKEAEDANSVIVSKLKDYIIALGFSESDLKTVNYNIYPEYDYSKDRQEITGYRATHSLKIEVSAEQTEKVSSIIDAGTNAGAGINYINFELSPSLEQQYKTEAIKDASEDARVKAEAVAIGFNKKLGRLVAVSLDQYNYYPRNIYTASVDGGAVAEEAKSAVATITPSEQDVSAYVTAVYKLR